MGPSGILLSGNHSSLSAELLLYLTKYNLVSFPLIPSLLSVTIFCPLSLELSASSTTGTGLARAGSSLLDVYGLMRLKGKTGCFLDSSSLSITSTAFLPCSC